MSESSQATGLLGRLWAKLEPSVFELTAHFCLSILAVVFVAMTEFALHMLHLDKKNVPIFDIPLEDWLFDFDIFSVSIILGVGCVKAVREMWWS